ncbi:DUF6471 domain-containing protein [Flocculibacter collagenilyticus]|uniref:DUF6471 domain-containing protein n=1 Tax=Flocculibacter collagenilyticus TaxID=2744479 RepID=UPI0018F449F3|nr:DUF6471 domain-containing protein [Flocculibacter collagenilyticus]
MPKKSEDISQELQAVLMVSKQEWKDTLSTWLSAFIRRANIDYKFLSDELWRRFRVKQKVTNLRSKFSQGTVDGQLLLQILLICEQTVNLEEIEEVYQKSVKQNQKNKAN